VRFTTSVKATEKRTAHNLTSRSVYISLCARLSTANGCIIMRHLRRATFATTNEIESDHFALQLLSSHFRLDQPGLGRPA
jgi:hypothetical protein